MMRTESLGRRRGWVRQPVGQTCHPTTLTRALVGPSSSELIRACGKVLLKSRPRLSLRFASSAPNRDVGPKGEGVIQAVASGRLPLALLEALVALRSEEGRTTKLGTLGLFSFHGRTRRLRLSRLPVDSWLKASAEHEKSEVTCARTAPDWPARINVCGEDDRGAGQDLTVCGRFSRPRSLDVGRLVFPALTPPPTFRALNCCRDRTASPRSS
jgi:hypothetical protein